MNRLLRTNTFKSLTLAIFGLVFLSACASAANPSPSANLEGKLQVVATTTILGDVVGQIGGENIDLHVLLPSGSDPHTFEPSPKDIAAITNADLVILNGAGLEAFMERLLESASTDGEEGRMVSASDGIELLTFSDEHAGENDTEGGEHLEYDPHVWFNPRNVMVWTENIERALIAADPENADSYRAKAEAYRAQLSELDTWIESQFAQIPPENRKLVTDHRTLGYFAERYGFEQVGAVIPGFSSASAPSAQELGALQESMRSLGARAIFVGSTVNPAISEQIASDTSVQLVPLYTDSLTDPGGEASSYLELMRFDVQAIVAALRESDGN